MAIIDEIGYLEADYLLAPYFEGTAFVELLLQVDRRNEASSLLLAQSDVRIDATASVLSEASRLIDGGTTLLAEVDRDVTATPKETLAQAERLISGATSQTLMEVSSGAIKQGDCAHEGYLARDYQTAPYLTGIVCASLLMQVERKPIQRKDVLAQVDRRIVDRIKRVKAQVERRIDATQDTLMQVEAKKSKTIGMQVRKVLYNTYNLRILYDFPSRGTSGDNWSVTTGQGASGDFAAKNLNSDIVEQVFRTGGTTATTGTTLVCDTEISSGVYVDTIGIIGHNLRVTGSVRVEGSQSMSFSNPVLYQLRPDGTENIIWIADTIPLQSYRYWRFTFSDAGNPDGYLQIGSIVFGSAAIFQGENVVDTIVKAPKHFADKVVTEGFTAVSNDRALKNAISLEFRSLDYTRENYSMLQQIFRYCRTSLKALWIPTPRTPTRFGVFGKLASIPSEQHQSMGESADYVSFSLEVDESL